MEFFSSPKHSNQPDYLPKYSMETSTKGAPDMCCFLVLHTDPKYIEHFWVHLALMKMERFIYIISIAIYQCICTVSRAHCFKAHASTNNKIACASLATDLICLLRMIYHIRYQIIKAIEKRYLRIMEINIKLTINVI